MEGGGFENVFGSFVIALFVPIVILFQIFMGFFVLAMTKQKEPENTYLMYFIRWCVGLLVSVVISIVLFPIFKFFHLIPK